MELVDGPTLSERMRRGPIPFDEAQPIALQMVDALAYAHEHNIVHRDLKPSNVKLTADGAVKVLDFGLAKALDPLASGGGAVADSPTITSPAAMTRAGMFIGTAAYMAPEQARGAVVDKRADIWAFGVVLFEMLSGRFLFSGETVTDTLANVLKTDINWSALPADTPATVRRLLRHCLTRDRKQRLQDIGDARIELAEAGAEPELRATTGHQPAPDGGWLRSLAWLMAGVALALAGVAGWSLRDTRAESAETLSTFLITPRDGVALDDPPIFAVSPDGRSIVLRGTADGATFLHIRSMATGAVERLENTRGVGNMTPFWSPDSKALMFSRGAEVLRIAVDGSRPERVSERANGGAWGVDDLVLLSGDGLRLVNLRTQAATRVDSVHKELPLGGSPVLLPDKNGFLVTDTTGSVGNTFYGTIDGSRPLRRLVAGIQPAYVSDWLLVVDDGRILAYPFDAAGGTVRGDAIAVHTDVRLRGGVGGRLFSVSTTGVLAIRREPPSSTTRLAWFDRLGLESGALKLDRHCRNPELSPTGDRVAVECYDQTSNTRDIWVYNLARDAASRLTTDPADDADPLWSPDGRRLVFGSNRSGPPDVYQKNSNGVTPESLVMQSPGATYPAAWSADGKHVVVMAGIGDLLAFEVDGDRTLKPLVTGPSQEAELQLSPGDQYFSYSSDESGRPEIYVQPWPPNGERWQVSTAGGADARWRSDGKELYYLNPAKELMAAAIDTSGGFKVSAPIRLFQTAVTGPIGTGHRFPYAVSRDGKRFLMYVSSAQTVPAVEVILNWPALSKQ
jgi:Tol biopolymer transport system component